MAEKRLPFLAAAAVVVVVAAAAAADDAAGWEQRPTPPAVVAWVELQLGRTVLGQQQGGFHLLPQSPP